MGAPESLRELRGLRHHRHAVDAAHFGVGGIHPDWGGQPLHTGIPSSVRDALLDSVPLGRAGTAREAADSIYLLCVPESDYISGQVLVVSGGLSL
ncbi:SDR family oxidoreductase [Sphingobium sp. CFD-2]|uniref:SDR family oxidoreductase n=1 Tax=Sphingobium sp. CFD-2 TaxID=2878542 RepID=UPI00214B6B17|nr:SDR family oxidoreductase [Sphingobium sp. CFD-2]